MFIFADTHLKNYNQYLTEKERLGKFKMIYADKIVLSYNEIKIYDLFFIPWLDPDTYISANLALEILHKKIMGVEIKKVDKLIII